MPTNAGSYTKTGQGPKGPAGTASQRASKQGKIKGRASEAESKVKSTPQTKLPDGQGR